jgi:hypothetical protein
MWLENIMNAWSRSAGLLGSACAVAAALLAVQPANAQQGGISTAAGISTPSCGLGLQPYPSCPTSRDDQRIAQGYKLNPVPLNLTGLDPRKVGIGSYWINSAGNCDGCHAGSFTSPPGQLTANGNPAQLPTALGGPYTLSTNYNGAIPYDPPSQENPASFLGGGNNFNPSGACDASGMGACGATRVLARNLTPDFTTGRPLPEQNTLARFITTLRTGHDFQNVGSTSTPVTVCTTSNGVQTCTTTNTVVTAPADGSKLSVMPWPAAGSATDYDLEAMYEYLKAIPCISNSNSPYPEIVHTCPAAGDPLYGTSTYHQYRYVNGQAQAAD